MRKVFAQELRQNYLINDKNSILLGDISVGLFLDDQDELVPNAYNMGILEQSMISFAAGLSTESDNVFVHTISPFIVERAYEQIKLESNQLYCLHILTIRSRMICIVVEVSLLVVVVVVEIVVEVY